MSLSRRLQRIVRAQLGALWDEPHDDDIGGKEEEGAEASPSGAAADSSSEVPPEVAEAYRALEVPVGSDRETVKKGYRRVMKTYHTDRFQQDEEKRQVAEEVSKRLNRARQRVLEYLDDADS